MILAHKIFGVMEKLEKLVYAIKKQHIAQPPSGKDLN